MGLGSLWAPIIVIYQLNALGLNLKEVMIGESVAAMFMLVFEIPSGIFADKIGRKSTVLFGTFACTIAVFIFSFATGFLHVLLTQALFGFGLAMISGADESLLYDSLVELKEEKRFKKITSQIYTAQYATAIFITSLGGFLAYHYSLTVPIFLTFIIWLLMTLFLILLKETSIQHKDKKAKQRTVLKHSYKALKYIVTHKYVRYTILFSIVLAFGIKVNFQTLNPYWELNDVPVWMFGLAFSALNAIAAITSHYAHQIEKKLGEKILLFVMLVIGAGIFILIANINVGIALALIIPAFYQINRALSKVVISDMINKVTYSHHRATVISMKSFLSNISIMILLPIFGYLTDTRGLLSAFNMTGVFILLVGGFALMHFVSNHVVTGEV